MVSYGIVQCKTTYLLVILLSPGLASWGGWEEEGPPFTPTQPKKPAQANSLGFTKKFSQIENLGILHCASPKVTFVILQVSGFSKANWQPL